MARAYRPRRPATTPLEVLHLLVDEHLADTPGRAPQRPAWDALEQAGQLAVVCSALTPEAIDDERAWLAGMPCARPLVGAVAHALTAHAPEELA